MSILILSKISGDNGQLDTAAILNSIMKEDEQDKSWVERTDPKYRKEFEHSSVGNFGFKGRC